MNFHSVYLKANTDKKFANLTFFWNIFEMLNYNSSTCHGIQDKSSVFYVLANTKYSNFEAIKSIQISWKIILFWVQYLKRKDNRTKHKIKREIKGRKVER